MSSNVNVNENNDRKKALKELRDIIRRYGLKFIADRYLEIYYKGYWFSLTEILHGETE